MVEEFVDNDVSATARRRPAFEAMMTAAQHREFEVIVAWHVDRLDRRLADLEPVLSACQAAGIQIATATGELDPGTDSGRLVARILSSVAQAEVERKGIRQRRANRQRAERGRVRLVRRPFGYRIDGRVVTGEARALRWVAAQVLTGRSVASLARELNARRVLTSTGARWRASSLIRVLRNPRYAGIATYHGAPVGVGTWRAILAPGVHEALVAELDDPVRRALADPVPKHLLSGLAVCGRCGERLGVNSDGRTGRRIYRCPRLHLSRRLDAVDAVVTDAILTRVRTRNLLEALGPPDPRAATLAHDIRREMARTLTLLRQAQTAFAAGDIDTRQLAAISRTARSRLARLNGDYAVAMRAPALAALATAAAASRPDRSLPTAWARLTHQQRRDVVAVLVHVTVLPAGPGRPFSADQVALAWSTSG